MIRINFWCKDEDLCVDFYIDLPFIPQKGQFVHIPEDLGMSSGQYRVTYTEIIIEDGLEDYWVLVEIELDHLR